MGKIDRIQHNIEATHACIKRIDNDARRTDEEKQEDRAYHAKHLEYLEKLKEKTQNQK